jgi:hypothetical protein
MNEDLFIKKVIKLEEDMIYVKEKIQKIDMLDDLIKGQDKMIAILERIDQERILTEHTLKKVEKEVGLNTMDIKKIKVQLHMV